MMAADSMDSAPRRGRRARALSEEEMHETGTGRRVATGDLSFFARRAACQLPEAQSPVPTLTRFDAPRALLSVFSTVRDEPAGEDYTPGVVALGDAPAPQRDLGDTHEADTTTFDPDDVERFIPAHQTEEDLALQAEAASEDADDSADADEPSAEDSQDAHDVRDDAAEDADDAEPVDDTAEAADAPEADEAESSGGAEESAHEESPKEEEADASTPAVEDEPEKPAAVWTSEPSARDALSPAGATARAPHSDAESAADPDAREWLEVGDLPADQAPEPKPAPRFEGTVLSKPSRTSGGIGAWITWILVFLLFAAVIALVVTGVIGPGMVNALPAPTFDQLDISGGLLA